MANDKCKNCGHDEYSHKGPCWQPNNNGAYIGSCGCEQYVVGVYKQKTVIPWHKVLLGVVVCGIVVFFMFNNLYHG